MRLWGSPTVVIEISSAGTKSGGDGDEGELAAPSGEQLRLVDAEYGDRLPFAAIHGQEAGVSQAAHLEGDLIAGIGDAGELDAAVILIGPEVGGFGRRAVVPPGKQCGDGDSGPLQRTRPMFDAMWPADTRLVPGCAVADRDHVRDRRRAARVAQNAVDQLQRAVTQPLGVGNGADTDKND